jgi:hypothetical protein
MSIIVRVHVVETDDDDDLGFKPRGLSKGRGHPRMTGAKGEIAVEV